MVGDGCGAPDSRSSGSDGNYAVEGYIGEYGKYECGYNMDGDSYMVCTDGYEEFGEIVTGDFNSIIAYVSLGTCDFIGNETVCFENVLVRWKVFGSRKRKR